MKVLSFLFFPKRSVSELWAFGRSRVNAGGRRSGGLIRGSSSGHRYPVVLGPLLHDAHDVLHLRVTGVAEDLQDVPQGFPAGGKRTRPRTRRRDLLCARTSLEERFLTSCSIYHNRVSAMQAALHRCSKTSWLDQKKPHPKTPTRWWLLNNWPIKQEYSY